MLKGTWKGTTKKGTHIYRVTGSADSIEQYEDFQAENLITDEDADCPLFFSKTLTKQGNLVFDEKNDRYRIEVTFESAVLIDAARNSFGATTAPNKVEEEQGEKPVAKTAKPKRSLKKA